MALGRKSWLFCGSDRGGYRAAVMYSLIVSAKMSRGSHAAGAFEAPATRPWICWCSRDNTSVPSHLGPISALMEAIYVLVEMTFHEQSETFGKSR
jgi:hypothetical protein